jgi:nanoRNase/pAp phosphatase (c-di-AMP/oligoRNAs hydrolase)
LKFGGGGHFGAAGFESTLKADEIAAMILAEFDRESDEKTKTKQ